MDVAAMGFSAMLASKNASASWSSRWFSPADALAAVGAAAGGGPDCCVAHAAAARHRAARGMVFFNGFSPWQGLFPSPDGGAKIFAPPAPDGNGGRGGGSMAPRDSDPVCAVRPRGANEFAAG